MRPITPRQLEVGRLISQGLTNEEIAERLLISPRTVRAHSDALRVALSVSARRFIGEALRERGLLNPRDM